MMNVSGLMRFYVDGIRIFPTFNLRLLQRIGLLEYVVLFRDGCRHSSLASEMAVF